LSSSRHILLVQALHIPPYLALFTQDNRQSFHFGFFHFLYAKLFSGELLAHALPPENISEGNYRTSIRNEGKIYSASGKGKFPTVAAADIAAVAVHLLTDAKSHNREYIILGPDLLSYDDVCPISHSPHLSLLGKHLADLRPCSQITKTLSEVLGKQITHVARSQDEQVKWLESTGLPEAYAQMLAGLEANWMGKGMEERLNGDVKLVTGKEPMGFRQFVKENKEAWL